MSNYTGMDISAVRSLSAQMQSSAGQIRDLMRQLTSQLDSTAWTGPDRERFVGEWQSTHVQQLTAVANSLDNASTLAARNATEQESASA